MSEILVRLAGPLHSIWPSDGHPKLRDHYPNFCEKCRHGSLQD